MIRLTCGHAVEDMYEAYPLVLGEEICTIEGYQPCLTSGCYCKDCYKRLLLDPEVITLLNREEENYLLYPELY